jgi:hypothetical protein
MNDSRRSTDEYENGTKAAASVMKAAASVITDKNLLVRLVH